MIKLQRISRLIVLSAALFMQQSASSYAQSPPPSQSSSSMLSLDGTPSVQPASDAKVFVTLTNTSPEAVQWIREPWCRLIGLTITDTNGNVQVPDKYHRTGCVSLQANSSGSYMSLSPEATYKGYGSEPQGIPLLEWGYSLQPGTYSIRAFPVLHFQLGDHDFTDSLIGTAMMTLTLH
jgi:hypothetical protein